MTGLTFSPWRDEAELLAVRDQFYPDPQSGEDLRASACRKVAVWKQRGNLPHAVEATALLTDAILHDDASKNSVFSIRATYAAAFCRFVTGFVDSKLNQRGKTMFQRAMDLGIPASFVELRHEATHRELPSLVVLRSATQRSLQWLWDNYWAKISASVAEKQLSATEMGFSMVLSIHLYTMEELCRSFSRVKAKERNTTPRATARDLAGYCRGNGLSTVILCRELMKNEKVIWRSRDKPFSMDVLFAVWDPFLQTISEELPGFLTTFAEEMADELSQASDADADKKPYYESLYSWLDHILTSKSLENHRWRLSLSYLRAVCEWAPNRWTKKLREILSAASHPPSISDDADPLQDPLPVTEEAPSNLPGSDDKTWTELEAYGWGLADNWIGRPLGVA